MQVPIFHSASASLPLTVQPVGDPAAFEEAKVVLTPSLGLSFGTLTLFRDFQRQ